MDQTQIHELLLYCLRVVPDEKGDGRLESLSSSDWNVFIKLSGRHGVAPLLYHRLRTFHSDIPIPANVMARLRHIYLQSAGRGMHLYHKLGKVLGPLRHANIPVIVLKGAHLAQLVYDNIALRPMGDVDVLVHKDDLMRVEAALLGMGYAPAECRRQIAKDICHFVYGLPNGELFVEVHWKFLPSMYRFKIDIDGQWERSRQAIIAGVEVSVLCPEDLLLHLCLHASKHLFEMGLITLYDILQTIRYHAKEIDWKQVRLRSEQSGGAKCVYLTFRLARELLGASVPDDLMKAIKPRDFDERFMVLAKERIFAYEHWNSDGLSLSTNIAQLWGSKRLRNKGTLFLRRAFPSPEEVARMYPAPSDSIRIYFYYAVRFKDLVLRHGRQVWRLLRRDEGMRGLTKKENDLTLLKEWLMSP
ncbi:MAG: nucleotidyltransferase family protein [Acidobacteriota bacterium]